MTVIIIFYVTLAVLVVMLVIRMHELKNGQRFFAEIRHGADMLSHRSLASIRHFLFIWLVTKTKQFLRFVRGGAVDAIFAIKNFIVHYWNKFETYLVGKGHVKSPSAVSFFWKTMAEYKSKHEEDAEKKELAFTSSRFSVILVSVSPPYAVLVDNGDASFSVVIL